jgi:hypothetical protein
MVDAISKAGAGKALDVVGGQDGGASPKTGESKFDKVRASLQEKDAQQVKIPPEVKHVSLPQQNALKAEMSSHLVKGADPKQLLSADLQRTKQKADLLTKRIDALPNTPALQPLRDRLLSIDTQFQNAGKLVNSIKGGETPQQLLKVQMSMYQLSENVELMSKAVEQVSSGMKNILQTQV